MLLTRSVAGVTSKDFAVGVSSSLLRSGIRKVGLRGPR